MKITKEDLKKFFQKKETLFGILVIFVSAIIVIILYSSKFIMEWFSDSLFKNLGSMKGAELIMVALLIFVVVFVLVSLVGFIGTLEFLFFNKKNQTRLIGFATVLSMVGVFILGVIGFNILYGQEDFGLYLRDQDLNKVGNMSCEGSSKIFFSSDLIKCETNPPLSQINASMRFTFDNNSYGYQNFSNLTFIAPENVKYIFFEINGIDEKGDLKYLNIGSPFRFFTAEEYETLNIKFLSFIYILLGIIFITIPTSAYYLRELFNPREN